MRKSRTKTGTTPGGRKYTASYGPGAESTSKRTTVGSFKKSTHFGPGSGSHLPAEVVKTQGRNYVDKGPTKPVKKK